jgi:hypothetical protein
VALGQVFLRVNRFSLSILFDHGSQHSYIAWRMDNRPVSGRISETSSHPVDMNMNSNLEPTSPVYKAGALWSTAYTVTKC